MEDSLRVQHAYYCAKCGESVAWSYYDLMQATDTPTLPCRCKWDFLKMEGQSQLHDEPITSIESIGTLWTAGQAEL